MDSIEKIIEICLSAIAIILFTLFCITIKKNSENIFFSMRSTNLMQITNLSLSLGILTLTISDIFYNDNNKDSNVIKLIQSFYFLFNLITFISLVLRYHRLYICCKTNELGKDDLLQFKFFEAKSYHYEYFYIRILAVLILFSLISLLLYFFLLGGDSHNVIKNIEQLLQNDELSDSDNNNNIIFIFWSGVLFAETLVYITYALLIIKTSFNPKVNIPNEILLLILVNYLYFCNMYNNFYVYEGKEENFKNNLIKFVPILYNFIIYFISIGLPFIWGKNNSTIINYDLPGELASSLYLFLTKEKCYDLFHNYLYNKSADREKNLFFLNLFINILKYRLLVFDGKPNNVIIEEVNNIELRYLDNNNAKLYFSNEVLKEATDICNGVRNGAKLKMSLFDKITGIVYDCLDEEFKKFTKSEEFYNLSNELTHDTYVRCKLTSYGLIRN